MSNAYARGSYSDTLAQVRFDTYREELPNEQFILSMLRLTENRDRLEFLSVVLAKGLLPPCYDRPRNGLQKNTEPN